MVNCSSLSHPGAFNHGERREDCSGTTVGRGVRQEVETVTRPRPTRLKLRLGPITRTREEGVTVPNRIHPHRVRVQGRDPAVVGGPATSAPSISGQGGLQHPGLGIFSEGGRGATGSVRRAPGAVEGGPTNTPTATAQGGGEQVAGTMGEIELVVHRQSQRTLIRRHRFAPGFNLSLRFLTSIQ